MHIDSRFRWVIITTVVIFLLAAGLFLGLHKTVSLSVDGEQSSLTTYALTVGNLLKNQGITLSPQDELTPAQDAWLKNGAVITLVHAIPVQVFSGGQLYSIYSADRIPRRLLAQAGVSLQPGDELLSNGKVISSDQPFPTRIQSIFLQVNPAVNFTLSMGDRNEEITSPAPTLGSALWSSGHKLYAADLLDPPSQTSLTPGMTAYLQPSHTVQLQTQDGTFELRTSADTVAGALGDAGLSLQGLDYSLPSPDKPIPADGAIRLVRVTEDVVVEQTPLQFETTYQPAPDVDLDSQAILQAGEYGLSAKRFRVRYEDGVEVSRQADTEWVASDPQPRIIGFGTKVVMYTEVVDGITLQYWRKLSMYATSYHPSNTGSTTASGLPLKKGVAAVDTSIIPFNTQMYVPGYGAVVAADIGGGVAGRMIDLGYSDDDYVPWHSWVTVYFLWPPPGNIVWVVP